MLSNLVFCTRIKKYSLCKNLCKGFNLYKFEQIISTHLKILFKIKKILTIGQIMSISKLIKLISCFNNITFYGYSTLSIYVWYVEEV